MDQSICASYIAILRHELVPALGCTEPIAIAFAASRVRSALGCMPEHLTCWLSGNIIKNVKSVIVPNAGGGRGIEMAASLGCVGGDWKRDFEVLEGVTEADIADANRLVASDFCEAKLADGHDNLYIRIEATAGGESAEVTVEREHTRVTCIRKNGKVVFSDEGGQGGEAAVDKSTLNVRDILTFAEEVDLEEIRPTLERQIRLNTAISREGLTGRYGAAVGKLIMSVNGGSAAGRAMARAAAGSDARMNGCSMPVVINSGSGNQGMTITLPVCEYAETWNVPHDRMLRALALANLISVHIKRHIGNLSAFCGAVSAACGAACGIAWMDGADYKAISMTITNMLCSAGGIVCDGAKSSCAMKIAESVHAGLLSYEMAKAGKVLQPGEGLVGENVEATIQNIGRMGRVGMRSTDTEILHIMVGD